LTDEGIPLRLTVRAARGSHHLFCRTPNGGSVNGWTSFQFSGEVEFNENGTFAGGQLLNAGDLWTDRLGKQRFAAGTFVRFNNGWTSPKDSRLRIVRHVEWGRSSGMPTEITPGFKNSGPLGGEKEQPIFPESFAALKTLYKIGAKGLIFHDGTGDVFSYQFTQRSYNRAFKRAGLPYSATHVMRHGGCRRVFNETKDLGVAAQILGNISLATVEVYAKRYKTALTELSQSHWERQGDVSLRST